MRADSVKAFDALAQRMADHPEIFDPLGDVDLDLALVMHRPGEDEFEVLLSFRGIGCLVNHILEGEEAGVDCYLEGPLDAWQEMFDDIVAHGKATGRFTLNSLTLVGDRIRVHGPDPLGVDRFFRYNQSVQEFFDGAAALAPAGA